MPVSHLADTDEAERDSIVGLGLSRPDVRRQKERRDSSGEYALEE